HCTVLLQPDMIWCKRRCNNALDSKIDLRDRDCARWATAARLRDEFNQFQRRVCMIAACLVGGEDALGLTAGGRFFVFGWQRMARQHCRIGVMFSTTGSYSVVARSMLNGALLAFREIAEAGGEFSLEPIVVNPSGELSRYRALSLELL